jgi:O-antigen ligase
MKVYVFTCVIASILGTVGFALGLDALTWDNRARGLLDDPNMYGSMLAPSVLCAIYLMHMRIVRRWIMLLALVILIVGIMLSFSRAAIVATMLVTAGYIFFLNRLRLARLLPVLLGLVLLALVLFAVTSLVSQEFTQKFFQRLTFAESYDLGREGRYGRYLLVLPMILDNPMGLGVLQLEKIFPEPIHNIFLSSFVNYGWTGGVTWLVLVGSSIVLAIENYRRTRSPVAILLLFTFLAVVMCASLHEGEHWRHLWLFIGLLWGFSQANFREAVAAPPPRPVRLPWPPEPATRPAVARVPAVRPAAITRARSV